MSVERQPDSSPGHRALSPETKVTASLARWLTVGIALVGGTTAFVSGYVNLRNKIEAHMGNTQVHLDDRYHLGHGQPVGNFDFTVAIQELKTAMKEARTVEMTDDCKVVRGKAVCTFTVKE